MGELSSLIGDLVGLVVMGSAAFVVVHAVLEWRATRRARRLSVSDADAIHARLDALGRQIDDLGRYLGAMPRPADPPRPALVPPERLGAPGARHPTPV